MTTPSCALLNKLLTCPVSVLAFTGLVSLASLLFALASEAFWGLEPCILCIYQRVPFALAIAFAVVGLIGRNNRTLSTSMIALTGIGFLVNSGIAFYHTGIEQKWWRSAVEGCAVPNFSAEPQSILENILSAPTGRCDEIPWQDPILNLSMANYNIALGFGLFVLCAISVFLIANKRAA
jgi:disulfide bond formation protein DsbB